MTVPLIHLSHEGVGRALITVGRRVALDQTTCIGCQSCSKVCPKRCHTHEPRGLAA